MVERHVEARGVRDPAVIDAMCAVPREAFLPNHLAEFAYADTPLSIEEGQTISQPFIVAMMAEALSLGPKDRVLEIGTGSGYYAAAVLAEIAAEVYTVDPDAAKIAKERYACLSPWERDPARYGRAATTEGYATCEAPVVAVLRDLLARRLEYAHNAFFTSPMFLLSCLDCDIQRGRPSKPRFRGISTPIAGSTKLVPSPRSQRNKHRPSFQRFTVEHGEMNR
jgi:hypothetical protein